MYTRAECARSGTSRLSRAALAPDLTRRCDKRSSAPRTVPAVGSNGCSSMTSTRKLLRSSPRAAGKANR